MSIGRVGFIPGRLPLAFLRLLRYDASMRSRWFLAGVAAVLISAVATQTLVADPFNTSKTRAKEANKSDYTTSPNPRNAVSGEGSRLGSGVKELNKTESLQLQGKFQGYRPADNSIIVPVDASYKKLETV